MDVKDIKDLILTIDKTSIESVEIEKSDIILRINKGLTNANKLNIEKLRDGTISKDLMETDDSNPKMDKQEDSSAVTDDENIYIVKSPMVGTFYAAPSPESLPFVKVGDKVEKGQTLCIVEAMKMMNEIKSQSAGEIIEILSEDEEIIEYGQPLIRIRR
ncbi:acetyl-CoA carboxylase biotin carboxyl carrier protein [Natronincola ferrireducens]|uniref:Biotin carboxyl carrier protein of acetyl-CoA carboxylase n=1 Tax=Natronincola ferrireducens TaxID=393762 RepID=A0A1G9A7P8_9FIRM|nr:acetyl-CoA carboxylase biotin carboxyl carrier protein [Natronincola ferrireducens]SDK23313.1 acetyl-CoA carboxylase biotin carboxyl carrier protein [Natronincola ferrireducens]